MQSFPFKRFLQNPIKYHFNRSIATTNLQFVRKTQSLYGGESTTRKNDAKHTSLYDFHVSKLGRLTSFANFLLPIQYDDQSIIESHLHTRSKSSIFDVSHMMQTILRGKRAIECIESITTADLNGLKNGASQLTIFTDANGGILDDLIVTRVSDTELYIVSNAGCRKQDKQLIDDTAQRYDVHVECFDTDEQSLIAIQGPLSVNNIIAPLLSENDRRKIVNLPFMHSATVDLSKINVNDVRITRCGYTGEDGIELSCRSHDIRKIIDLIFENTDNNSQIKMAGLGVRDTLRLEAGLCLYGTDIDANTTPCEAGLGWLITKRRRGAADFPGAIKVLRQMYSSLKLTKKRVGMRYTDTSNLPAARNGAKLYANIDDSEEQSIGFVTSGCRSPTLNYNIAMGYLTDQSTLSIQSSTTNGRKLYVAVRDKRYQVELCRMPFVKTNYFTVGTK